MSESDSHKLKGSFLLSIKRCFFVVVLFYKIENHLLKVLHLNLRIQKANSCIHSMPMFIFVIFDISTSCAVFLLFFWLTLTSMIHAINVPFLSNLTFPSMSSPLLPLFTFVCCKCIAHCFVNFFSEFWLIVTLISYQLFVLFCSTIALVSYAIFQANFTLRIWISFLFSSVFVADF